MTTCADFGGWVISTIGGWFIVTADKHTSTVLMGHSFGRVIVVRARRIHHPHAAGAKRSPALGISLFQCCGFPVRKLPRNLDPIVSFVEQEEGAVEKRSRLRW